MDTFLDKKNAKRMGKLAILFGIVVVLYVGMKFLNETKRFNEYTSSDQISTVDVSGTGEAFAVPTIASETFTVEQKAATVHDAQTTVTKKVNDIVTFLKASGVATKDIQTTNYSAYPEYDYSSPCSGKLCTTNTTPKLIGYDVSQTITVKIRDTAAVGKIVDGLGTRGVTGLSGPEFTIDNPDAVNAQARAKAINDAREKAQVLASQLGVTLVRVVRFSENGGGGYPMPMYAKDMAVGSAAPATSQLPVGQNKYTSNVTVTYEIR